MTYPSIPLLAGVAALVLLSPASGQPVSGAALSGAGDFAGAARAYQTTLETAPTDPAALAGLARVRLYENRVDEAIALAQQALGADPASPVARATLGAAQQRKAAFGPDRYQIAGSPPEAVIPFIATDPLPVVQVAVGGRQANFLIDTGAPDISVSADLVQALGLKVQDAGQGVFAGGQRAAVQRTLTPEFQVGPIKAANVPATVMRQTPPIPGAKLDGIVGTGFLMHFLTTLDYCQGRLILRPRSASAAFEQAAVKSGANVVPFWLVGDHFMMARAHLQRGSEGMFLIDTGLAGGGISAPKATLDEAGVIIDPANARTGMGGGGPVTFIPFRAGATLGAMTVEDVPGSYSPSGDPASVFPFKVSGLLSHMFFRHSRLTFDFDAMKLVTEAC